MEVSVELMSDSRSRRARTFISASVLLAGALGACASAPPPVPEVARRLSPSEEAAALEAAKHHPIALTYERPSNPNALPVAPPPVPPAPENLPPPPGPEVTEAPAAPPAPRDQVIIVGSEAPPPSAQFFV